MVLVNRVIYEIAIEHIKGRFPLATSSVYRPEREGVSLLNQRHFAGY